MQKLPNQHFRLRVLAFYPAHVVASRFLIVHIRHKAKLGYEILKLEGEYGNPLPYTDTLAEFAMIALDDHIESAINDRTRVRNL